LSDEIIYPAKRPPKGSVPDSDTGNAELTALNHRNALTTLKECIDESGCLIPDVPKQVIRQFKIEGLLVKRYFIFNNTGIRRLSISDLAQKELGFTTIPKSTREVYTDYVDQYPNIERTEMLTMLMKKFGINRKIARYHFDAIKRKKEK
jgi:hypothetical protein